MMMPFVITGPHEPVAIIVVRVGVRVVGVVSPDRELLFLSSILQWRLTATEQNLGLGPPLLGKDAGRV